MFADDNDTDGAREVEQLASVVDRITDLPLGWAVVASLLMGLTLALFGAAVLVVVLMVKAARGTCNVLTLTPGRGPGTPPPGAVP